MTGDWSVQVGVGEVTSAGVVILDEPEAGAASMTSVVEATTDTVTELISLFTDPPLSLLAAVAAPHPGEAN